MVISWSWHFHQQWCHVGNLLDVSTYLISPPRVSTPQSLLPPAHSCERHSYFCSHASFRTMYTHNHVILLLPYMLCFCPLHVLYHGSFDYTASCVASLLHSFPVCGWWLYSFYFALVFTKLTPSDWPTSAPHLPNVQSWRVFVWSVRRNTILLGDSLQVVIIMLGLDQS